MPLCRSLQRVCLVLLILVWAGEVFYWQQITRRPDLSPDWPMLACRACLDLLAATLFVRTLPKLGTVLLMAGQALLALAIYAYWNYFHSELRLTPLLTQWREGAAMGGDLFSTVPVWTAALAAFLFLGKCGLLRLTPPPLRGRRAARLAGVCLGGLAAALLLGNLLVVNMFAELKSFSSSRNIATYGYLLSWGAELGFAEESDFFDPHPASRRLVEQAAPLTSAEDIIIVQVESLDYGALHWVDRANRPLTPFLNELAAASEYHRIISRSQLGSASADCAVLMQEAVNRKVIPYKLESYPFDRPGSLPRLAGNAGYRTTALHGFDGNFFNRKSAYARMGFAQILFKEDLDAAGGLDEPGRPATHNFFATYGYLDRAMLNLAAQLAARPGKDLVFVITLTNHTPWEYLPESEQAYFPEPKSKFENFCNSINYVDRCLAEFYQRIPEGTLLLIYGDHAAVFPELNTDGDYVPYIIHRKSGPLVSRENPPGIRDQPLILEDIAGHIGTLFRP